MSTVTAVCSRKFRASRTSGTRSLSQIRWIVLHDTEGGSAESVARFFSNPEPPPPRGNGPAGSAHLAVDEVACYRCLDNVDVPWGAHGANESGFHIEQCGFAKWSLTTWLLHRQTLRRAAYKTALHCHLFDIPPVFVWAPGLNLGKRGVTTHAECTKAFGGTHTDPGPFWPRRLFMRYVREYAAELQT